MQYELYNALKSELETKLTWLKHVDLYNSQMDNEDVEIAFDYPAIFIEFANISYTDLTQGVQIGDFDVNIHLTVTSLERTHLDILQKKQEVHSVVHYFQSSYNTKMLRRSESIATNHSNVMEYVITYHVTGKDFTASKLPTTEATIDKLTLIGDSQITNHIINTGAING